MGIDQRKTVLREWLLDALQETPAIIDNMAEDDLDRALAVLEVDIEPLIASIQMCAETEANMSQQDRGDWKWEFFTRCWMRGADKIYPAGDGYIIASHDTWLPGSFPTFEEAAEALDNHSNP